MTETKTLQAQLLELRKNINNPVKNANNPFFRSKYTDLNEVLSVISEALPEGLSFVQPTRVTDTGATVLDLEFFTATESKVVSSIPVIEMDGGKTNRLQMYGQSLTYLRRYLLVTYLGLGSEDNDGNTPQQQRNQPVRQQVPQQAPQQDENTKLLVQQLEMKTKKLAQMRQEDPNKLIKRLGDLDHMPAANVQRFLNSVNKAIAEEKGQ